jgi:cold shock CspA family protein
VTGVVTAFDPERGLGTVAADADGGDLPFHCTAIADGTRAIEVGTSVVFRSVPGHLGRMEARDLVAV